MKFTALVDRINRAIADHALVDDVVRGVRGAVTDGIADEGFVLECVERLVAHAEHHASHGVYLPLHTEAAYCWCVKVFLWPPAFANTPHQHNTWSVSGILHNQLEVALYRREGDGGAPREWHRFVARRGQTGYLTPPCIHALGNPDATTPSVTLHVFQQSSTPQQRLHDTQWLDEQYDPQHVDAAVQVASELQAALLLLQSYPAALALPLLQRICAVGNTKVQLAAFKQLVRHDEEAALACGEHLARQLDALNLPRFLPLLERLRASVEARRTQQAETAVEFDLQYAMARLAGDRRLLEQTLRQGVAATLDTMAPASAQLLTTMLAAHGRRFLTLATMLDERALDNVLYFLPLVAAALAPAQLSPLWRHYRDSDSQPIDDYHAAALAFCAHTLRGLPRVELDDPWLEVMQYEYALMRVRARAAAAAPAPSPPSAPMVVANHELVPFRRAISTEVAALRALLPGRERGSWRRLGAERAAHAPAPALAQTLLFYAARQDQQIRVLRVDPETVMLLGACDGDATRAPLPRRLAALGYPPARLATLDRSLAKLHDIGVLQSLPALPAAAPLVSESHT